MKPRGWYRFVVKAEADVADLYVYDVIGPSYYGEETVSAKQFIADLAALPESVKVLRLHVNSPGGDVFDAVAIANTLRAQSREQGRRVEAQVEGLAASAATIITSAGDSIKVAENALMMVHNPWSIAFGEAKDMRAAAEALDTVRDAIIATYRWHSALEPEALGALMDATTWMDAREALANGFATEIMQAVAIAASFDPKIVAKLPAVPDKYRPALEAMQAKPEPTPAPPAAASAPEVLALVEAAGLGTGVARELLAAALPLEGVQARIAAAVDARTTAEARAKEIRALCATAKCPELADGYIRGGMAVADIKAHLTSITARLDKAEIDAGLPPDAGRPAPKARLNYVAIYAERNGLGAAQKET